MTVAKTVIDVPYIKKSLPHHVHHDMVALRHYNACCCSRCLSGNVEFEKVFNVLDFALVRKGFELLAEASRFIYSIGKFIVKIDFTGEQNPREASRFAELEDTEIELVSSGRIISFPKLYGSAWDQDVLIVQKFPQSWAEFESEEEEYEFFDTMSSLNIGDVHGDNFFIYDDRIVVIDCGY